MKELKKTKRLSISVIGYVAIILIGVLSIGKTDIRFTENREAVLLDIEEMSYEMFPDEVLAIVADQEEGYLIVDLRSEYDYIKDHLEGAVNIPKNMILEKENLKVLNKAVSDSLTVILYGETQLDANGPWMILRQLGYSNLKVMLGGYAVAGNPDFDPNDMAAYLIEEPVEDFYGIMMDAMEQSENTEYRPVKATQIVPVQRVEEDIDEGGC
jgi:rhodanese-related sulfurtransferase